MVKVGILGAAGYTGGELIRVLLNHPEVEIVFVNSESNAGNKVADVHEGLIGDTDLCFTAEMPFETVDVVFLCFGHGKSVTFLKEHEVPASVKIIDLSQDFRLIGNHDFFYATPDLCAPKIAGHTHIANPGCFATCIEDALAPLVSAGFAYHDIVVNALTGSTGAGQKPSATTHFSWRSGNLSIYKPMQHQHLHEICQTMNQLRPANAPVICDVAVRTPLAEEVTIDFIPYRGDFPRGIFCTAVAKFDGEEGSPTNPTAKQLADLYSWFYDKAAFVHYSDNPIDLKQVIGTNKVVVHVDKFSGNKAVITCALDNLLKGAVGQAVQNMNLICGLKETTGLHLKAIAF